MKYTKIYDKTYTTQVIGYKPNVDGYSIYKDAHTTWNGTEIVDGWEVYDGNDYCDGSRVYYASTLKEAKAWIENNAK